MQKSVLLRYLNLKSLEQKKSFSDDQEFSIKKDISLETILVLNSQKKRKTEKRPTSQCSEWKNAYEIGVVAYLITVAL